mgnify:CR=1 FL=1
MYIVENMTRHEIALGDLRAIIRPGKREDLDRFAARYVVEQSSDLRIALKRGALRLVRKDNPYGTPEPAAPSKPEKPAPDNSEQIMKAMQEMEKRLVERLNNQVEKHVGQQGLDEDSVGKLNAAIEALRGIAGGGGGTTAATEAPSQEYEVEDEKVVDIHERSINRLTKGARSKIQHKEETQSSDADANISELEDLL